MHHFVFLKTCRGAPALSMALVKYCIKVNLFNPQKVKFANYGNTKGEFSVGCEIFGKIYLRRLSRAPK
jgi:hypothetical protein